MMDYVRIAEVDQLIFLLIDDKSRRNCFPLQITDDGLVEDIETFTIDLVFSSLLPLPSNVVLEPNVTTVEISGKQHRCALCTVPCKCVIHSVCKWFICISHKFCACSYLFPS